MSISQIANYVHQLKPQQPISLVVHTFNRHATHFRMNKPNLMALLGATNIKSVCGMIEYI